MRSTLQRLAAGCGGNIALEFSLALPILTLLLLGLLDLGRFSMQKSALLQGAQEGANYGIQYPDDTTGITSTAQNATGLTGVTVTPSVFCECTAGTPVTPCDKTATCPGGGGQKKYVKVKLDMTFSSVLSVTKMDFGKFGSWTPPTAVTATVYLICANANCWP
jgi:Flp pilus assembly protein TadG